MNTCQFMVCYKLEYNKRKMVRDLFDVAKACLRRTVIIVFIYLCIKNCLYVLLSVNCMCVKCVLFSEYVCLHFFSFHQSLLLFTAPALHFLLTFHEPFKKYTVPSHIPSPSKHLCDRHNKLLLVLA